MMMVALRNGLGKVPVEWPERRASSRIKEPPRSECANSDPFLGLTGKPE